MGQRALNGGNDVAEIRFTIAIQRCRDANNDCIYLFAEREVRRRLKSLRPCALDNGRWQALNVAPSRIQLLHLGAVDVKAGDFQPHLGKPQCQWKADIAQSVDANMCGARVDFGLQGRELWRKGAGHGLRQRRNEA